MTDIDAIIKEKQIAMQQAIAASIVNALEPMKEVILGEMVNKVLLGKVDERGKHSDYGKQTYLEFCSQTVLADLIKQILNDMVQDNKEAITKKLKESLAADDLISTMLMKGFTESVESTWKTNIVVQLKKTSDYD